MMKYMYSLVLLSFLYVPINLASSSDHAYAVDNDDVGEEFRSCCRECLQDYSCKCRSCCADVRDFGREIITIPCRCGVEKFNGKLRSEASFTVAEIVEADITFKKRQQEQVCENSIGTLIYGIAAAVTGYFGCPLLTVGCAAAAGMHAQKAVRGIYPDEIDINLAKLRIQASRLQKRSDEDRAGRSLLGEDVLRLRQSLSPSAGAGVALSPLPQSITGMGSPLALARSPLSSTSAAKTGAGVLR